MANTKNISIREQLFNDVGDAKSIRKTLSNEIEIEMRQPTKGQRNKMIAESRMDDGESINPMDFMMRVIINCTHVPGKNAKVFTPKDLDRLNNLANADWVDELVEIAQEIVSIRREELEKN